MLQLYLTTVNNYKSLHCSLTRWWFVPACWWHLLDFSV